MLFSHSAYSQSRFYDEDDTYFEQETGIEPSDSSQIRSDENDLFKDSTLTLGYQFSFGTDQPDEVIDHNTYLRIEFDRLVYENLFIKFDGKAQVHLSPDHMATAENKTIFFTNTLRQAYIQAGFEDFSLTFGNQVHVWGKSDTAAITDVLSPRDESRFIFTKLEDARFGQPMISANLYFSDASTFIFISPLPQTDREPEYNSRYFRKLSGIQNFTLHEDNLEFGDLEFGFKIDKTIQKTDLSFMGGRFFANAAVYDDKNLIIESKPVIEKTYPDYLMTGTAVTHAWGNFIYKLEAAFKLQFPLQGMTHSGIYSLEKRNLIDAGIGIEYNANDRYQMSLELSGRHISSTGNNLAAGTDQNSKALYYTFSKDYLNNTLLFEYIFYYHFDENNTFHQFEITYDLTDTIELVLNYTMLHANDPNSLLWEYRNEDRAGIEIKSYF